MALYFEILNGEQAGQRFSVRSGITMGRRNTDITLRDSKVSGHHATVSTGPEGGLFLMDEGSSNGIKVAGQKVYDVELLVGVEFQIGRTFLRVVEMDPAEAGEILIEEPKTWQQIVTDIALRGMEQARPPTREAVVGFDPPLIFKFTQGVQAGQEWIIGYGPREVGSASLDLILDEPGLPPQCFRLLPGGDGPLLQNEGAIEIKLNGEPVQTHSLRDGDELEIKTTRIKISLST